MIRFAALPRLLARTMSNPAPRDVRYRFGPFELDPSQGRLSRSGSRVKLQDLPLRLLVLLVERPSEIVTREELRQRLWPEDTFVEFDNSLGVAVRKLREALRDNADAPRYVETVPRRGYRFVAPVTVQGPDEAPDSDEADRVRSGMGPGARNLRDRVETPPPTLARSASRPRYWITAGLVLLMVGIAVYEFRSYPRQSAAKAESARSNSRLRPRRAVAVLGFRNLAGRPNDNWLSTAFTEMLSTELAAGGSLRLVPGEDVARAKRELPLADEDTLAKSTLERLRDKPGRRCRGAGRLHLVAGQR